MPEGTAANSNGLLVIKDIQPSSAGTYTCIGANIYAQDEVTIQLIVVGGN